MKTYGIWCEVWGGVTGSRGSWLKVNGEIQRYPTVEEATAIANDIQQRRNANLKANFSYTAKEFVQ